MPVTTLRHGHCVGGKASPTYRSWYNMIQRCSNPKVPGYKNYGARGITFSFTWLSFDQFLRDMGARPSDTTLGRINTNGMYCKSNCRWATRKQQAASRRTTKLTVTDVGKIRRLLKRKYRAVDIAGWFGVKPSTIGNIKRGRSWQ